MTAPRASTERSLVRAIGTWALAAGVINVTVGGGIFRLPANVAAALGPAAPTAYIVCAVAMGLIVLCFAEAGSRVSLTGGPYAYVEHAFGPYVGFLTGVLIWLLGTTAVAAVSTVFATNVAQLFPVFAQPAMRALLLISTFAIVAVVNILGVKQGSRLNGIATVAKLMPLVLLVVAGVFFIDSANLRITTAPAVGDVTRASIVLMFAFSGVESALVPSGEVKDPARTVPRAIFIAMLAITLLYIAIQIVAQGVLGSALPSSATPLADAAGAVLGPWGRVLLLSAVVVSTFGYLSGMTLAIPRALYAFGRDGYLPSTIANVHARYHTPHIAIALQTVLACGLAIMSGFGQLAVISNVAALLVYFGCSVAAWQLRRRNVAEGGVPFRVPGAAVVPILSCAMIIGLLSSITWPEWRVLIIVIAVASAIFVVTRRRRAALAPRVA
ncbi:MAG TPA: amino acid permease [Gemmatimonadaceae bacterium]|nr:amino acid permease [Gemmatimonadaceae bacterium]